MEVVLVPESRDQHGAGCACGGCDRNGHACVCRVLPERLAFRAADSGEVQLACMAAPTPEAAMHNAYQWCAAHEHAVVQPSVLQCMLRDGFCACDHRQPDTLCLFCSVRACPDDDAALGRLYDKEGSHFYDYSVL